MITAAYRFDARTRRLARPRVRLPTQHVPAESAQRWSASGPAVLPMQVDERRAAVDELCGRRLGEDVCG
eukprot:7145278-Alexandrium_andersonii.AAC.1